MSEVLEVVVLRKVAHLFILATCLSEVIHSVVEAFSVVNFFGFAFLLLRNFWSVDFCRKVWLLSS